MAFMATCVGSVGKIKTAFTNSFSRFRQYVSGYYDAGRRDLNSIKGWQPKLLTTDEEVLKDYDLIRARSRDLYRNNYNGRAVIKRFVTSVIGRGLKVQPRIDYQRLGMTRDQAQTWQAEVETKFRSWATSKECDIRRKKNFYQLQALAYKMMLKDGDCFIMLPSKERGHFPFHLRVQLVSSMHVASPSTIPTENIRAGVELSDDGEPLAYYLCMQTGEYKRMAARGQYSGRTNIIHLFEAEDIDQTRGLPVLYPVIVLIKDMATYFRAELQSSIVNSLFTVVLKDEADDGMSRFGDERFINEEDLSKFKLGPGAVLKLPAHQSFDVVNPARPVSNFPAYIESLSNAVALGADMPHEVFMKKFMSSYSAARAALLDFKENKEIKRQWFVEDFCEPVYQSWLYERVLLGDIHAEGFLYDPTIRECYCRSNWIGDSSGQIDELKEVNAVAKRLSLGLSTHEKESIQLNGTKFSENVATLRHELDQLRELEQLKGEVLSAN